MSLCSFCWIVLYTCICQLPGGATKWETCLTADTGVASSIPALSHTFMEIDHEIVSTAILLPSADSRKVVSYKGKYVHEVLVNGLVKLAQETKVWLGELIVLT